jgi:hypothetical protein
MPAVQPDPTPRSLSAAGGDSPFAPPDHPAARRPDESCEICGSADTLWRNCKLVCRNCGGVTRSCADL